MTRVLIVGGYGAFGSLIAERLAQKNNYKIVIAGRNERKAKHICDSLGQRTSTKATLTTATIDATACSEHDLPAIAPDIVINAAGPYHKQDYRLARCTIAAGCHYIDLADNRNFVTNIQTLDTAAKHASVAVISGASTVPGLSSAVLNKYAPEFSHVDEVHIGISPGNQFDPGPATTSSVLANVGKPFSMLINGHQTQVFGWQNLSRHHLGDLGYRWMGNVDVPDLSVLPAAFPNLKTATFKAGLEVSLFHLGLWSASWLVRAGVVRGLEPFAPALRHIKSKLTFLGSNRGGMFVDMKGIDSNEQPTSLNWKLVAKNGHGPYIPAMPSVILTQKLASGTVLPPGAYPCVKLFSIEDFDDEIADLDIHHSLTHN